MVQLIDKDALVAEIEKLQSEIAEEKKLHEDNSMWYNGINHGFNLTKDILNDLEVKDLQEEPVSIDFEQELYKAFGQVKDFTLGMRIAKWFYDMGKNSQEPVSEELEKEIDWYFAKWLQGASDEGCFNPNSQLVSIYDCHRIARHFANWQKERMLLNNDEYQTVPVATLDRLYASEKKLDQMMKDAIERTVKVDAGGYPYIDCDGIELYDYENDKPLAKKGQKAKVIIILED